jgi:uncharacterized membrane protein YhaH (DUF805 family)
MIAAPRMGKYMGNLVANFTGMDGRINRQSWWIGVVVLIVVAIVLNLIIGAIFGGAMPSLEQLMDPAFMAAYAQKQGWIGLIIGLITAYPYIAISVKRRHDRDNNGYDAIGLIVFSLLWSLIQALGVMTASAGIGMVISIVFLIYAVYMLVQLGFLKGTAGPNAYGPDPLQG